MYNASLAFTKFSILFQYLRIFPGKPFRLACYVTMAIVATYSSWAIVSGFVNCVPVAKFWIRDLPGSCLNFEAIWFFNAAMNITTDITLLLLPMPLLSKLQLPRTQKIALMGVFAIGILVVVTSILRLSSLRQVAKSPDTSCTPYSCPLQSTDPKANPLYRQQRHSRLLDRRRMQRRHHVLLPPILATHNQPYIPQVSVRR